MYQMFYSNDRLLTDADLDPSLSRLILDDTSKQEYLLKELEILKLEVALLKQGQATLLNVIGQAPPVAFPPLAHHLKEEIDHIPLVILKAIKANGSKATPRMILEYIDRYGSDLIPTQIIDRLGYLKRRIRQLVDTKKYRILKVDDYYVFR